MRLAIAVSLAMHALLALALPGHVPAPPVKPRPAEIEIDVLRMDEGAAGPAMPALLRAGTSAAEAPALPRAPAAPARTPMPRAPAAPARTPLPRDIAQPRAPATPAPARRPRSPARASQTAEPAPPLAQTGWLSMRGTDAARRPGEPSTLSPEVARPGQSPARTPIDLSPAHAARLVAPEAPPPERSPLELPGPPPAAADVRDAWSPAGGGTYRADDVAFTATIERDGRVTIEDKPSFQWKLGRPRVNVEEDPPGQEGAGRSAPAAFVAVELATFDLTDWVMRMAGQDPYSQRKARFLDHSRDARADMRARAHAEDLRDAVAALPGTLRAIWQDTSRSPAERRAMLFQLWDECAETGPADVVRRSNTARAMILAFIRRHLPAGSPHAYADAEIDALNAGRKSEQAFAPYR